MQASAVLLRVLSHALTQLCGEAMQMALAAWMQGARTGWYREQDAHGASKGPEQPCNR